MSQSGSIGGSGGGGGAHDLHVAKFIVSSAGIIGTGANYTTIASAITAAVAVGGRQTIFIQPGTYTENLTLQAGINLCAFSCDAQTTASTPNVLITGSHTATFSGSACFSGIAFSQTASQTFIVSGSNPTALLFTNCLFVINTTSNLFRFTSSGSPYLRLMNCTGICSNLTSTVFSMTTGSVSDIFNCQFLNPLATTGISSTITDSTFNVYNSFFGFQFGIATSSGTPNFNMSNSKMVLPNQTCLSFTATNGTHSLINCSFESGTSSALGISGVGAPVTVSHCAVSSSNTNAITGGGEIKYGFISFYGSSSTVNTTTQTALATLI